MNRWTETVWKLGRRDSEGARGLQVGGWRRAGGVVKQVVEGAGWATHQG